MRAGRARAGRRRRLRRAHRCRRSETCHAHCVAWSRAWFGGCARLGAWTPARTSRVRGSRCLDPGAWVRGARGFGCWPDAGWGKCRVGAFACAWLRLLAGCRVGQMPRDWYICTAARANAPVASCMDGLHRPFSPLLPRGSVNCASRRRFVRLHAPNKTANGATEALALWTSSPKGTRASPGASTNRGLSRPARPGVRILDASHPPRHSTSWALEQVRQRRSLRR